MRCSCNQRVCHLPSSVSQVTGHTHGQSQTLQPVAIEAPVPEGQDADDLGKAKREINAWKGREECCCLSPTNPSQQLQCQGPIFSYTAPSLELLTGSSARDAQFNIQFVQRL